jgi:hypothetical protein
VKILSTWAPAGSLENRRYHETTCCCSPRNQCWRCRCDGSLTTEPGGACRRNGRVSRPLHQSGARAGRGPRKGPHAPRQEHPDARALCRAPPPGGRRLGLCRRTASWTEGGGDRRGAGSESCSRPQSLAQRYVRQRTVVGRIHPPDGDRRIRHRGEPRVRGRGASLCARPSRTAGEITERPWPCLEQDTNR